MDQPFLLYSFPRAILHVDGDAFFASVEMSVNPALKGRPLVTGAERGIIACASYEAKALGIKRGIPLHEARRLCPGLVVLPSDYETYSLYSRRMFDIMRRHTPTVEEYSIDEGFADITGLRRIARAPYEAIARRIQQDIRRELDLDVSIGLSLTKTLAKLASKAGKPAGLLAIPGREIHRFLQTLPLDKVWGFGPNTVQLLAKFGLSTAHDFASRPEAWAVRVLGKVGREIWNELRGVAMRPVLAEEKPAQASLSKGKTFPAPSADPDYVHAALLRNVESAFIKLRRNRLRAGKLAVVLREKDYSQQGLETELPRATSATQEALPAVNALFGRLHRAGIEYRATMIILTRLEPDCIEQPDLFEDRAAIEKFKAVSRAIDEAGMRFGKHSISLGSGLFLRQGPESERSRQPERKTRLLPGETARRRLPIPYLAIRV